MSWYHFPSHPTVNALNKWSFGEIHFAPRAAKRIATLERTYDMHGRAKGCLRHRSKSRCDAVAGGGETSAGASSGPAMGSGPSRVRDCSRTMLIDGPLVRRATARGTGGSRVHALCSRPPPVLPLRYRAGTDAPALRGSRFECKKAQARRHGPNGLFLRVNDLLLGQMAHGACRRRGQD